MAEWAALWCYNTCTYSTDLRAGSNFLIIPSCVA